MILKLVTLDYLRTCGCAQQVRDGSHSKRGSSWLSQRIYRVCQKSSRLRRARFPQAHNVIDAQDRPRWPISEFQIPSAVYHVRTTASNVRINRKKKSCPKKPVYTSNKTPLPSPLYQPQSSLAFPFYSAPSPVAQTSTRHTPRAAEIFWSPPR